MSTQPVKRTRATEFSAARPVKEGKTSGSRPLIEQVTLPFPSPAYSDSRPLPGSVLPLFFYSLWQNLKTGLPLLVMDIVGLAFAITCGSLAESLLAGGSSGPILQSHPFMIGVVFLVAYSICGLYPGVGVSPVVELKQMVLSSIASGVMIQAAALSFSSQSAGAFCFILTTTTLAAAVVPTLRCVSREVFSAFDWWAQPAIIVGAGESAEQLLKGLRSKSSSGLNPIGIIGNRNRGELSEEDFLGELSKLSEVARARRVFWALIPMNDSEASTLSKILQQCVSIPNLIVVPHVPEFPGLWSRTRDVGGMLGLHVRERLVSPTAQIMKRVFDLIAVVLGSLVLSPFLICLFVGAALVIKIRSPGPVFYSQERIGKGGRKFRAWKFRTMVLDADLRLKQCLDDNPTMLLEWEASQKLRNDPRIIPGIGNLLRKCSFDELPQLWNVIIGDMSLVGPRPFMEDQERFYGEALHLYHKVRPGITGLWQISGRNHTTFHDRVKYDAYYVRNWSLWLDIFILGRTVRTVLFREGAF